MGLEPVLVALPEASRPSRVEPYTYRGDRRAIPVSALVSPAALPGVLRAEWLGVGDVGILPGRLDPTGFRPSAAGLWAQARKEEEQKANCQEGKCK